MSCKSGSNNVCCGGACMTKKSCSLITWEDPKKSGIVLSSILSLLLLVKYVNVLSLFFRISTFILLISGLVEYSSKAVTGKGLITSLAKPYSNKNLVGNCVEYYAPHVVKVFKKIEINITNLYFSTNVDLTLKSGIAAYFLYKLTSALSLWCLSFYTTILAFTAPKIYLLNKELIDSNIQKLVKLLNEKSSECLKSVETKFGPQIKKVKEVTAPIFKLVESKLPVRTAGTTVNETKSTATTTSTNIHESTPIETTKQSVTETEVDFNKLGEELKKEAAEATQNAEAYTKEKIDAPPSF